MRNPSSIYSQSGNVTSVEASWDWSEEFDSDSTRDSDNEMCPGGQIRQAKWKASDENECAVDLDAKQAELEEKTRFAASFNTTCGYKLADEAREGRVVPESR